MKTRIHFEVLNSKMVLSYRKIFVESCTINFMMQTAVMSTKYRSGFCLIFNLRINLDTTSRVPARRALPVAIHRQGFRDGHETFHDSYGRAHPNNDEGVGQRKLERC
jgi:hypothetical protein